MAISFFIPDIARTAEDFERATDLVSRNSTMNAIPSFGTHGNLTYVLRDEKDRSIILGVTHVEMAPEVTCMIVDDRVEAAKRTAYTLLHRGMEMNLRQTGHSRYYMTVPQSDTRVLKAFFDDGAERIDGGMVRFLKRL